MLCVRTEFRKGASGWSRPSNLRQGRSKIGGFEPLWAALSLLQVNVLYFFDCMAEEAFAKAPEFLD